MDLVHELIQRTQTQRKFREHVFAMKDIQDHCATNFSAGNFGNRQQNRFFCFIKIVRYMITILIVWLFPFRSSTDELIDCGEHGVCLEAVGRLIWNQIYFLHNLNTKEGTVVR